MEELQSVSKGAGPEVAASRAKPRQQPAITVAIVTIVILATIVILVIVAIVAIVVAIRSVFIISNRSKQATAHCLSKPLATVAKPLSDPRYRAPHLLGCSGSGSARLTGVRAGSGLNTSSTDSPGTASYEYLTISNVGTTSGAVIGRHGVHGLRRQLWER